MNKNVKNEVVNEVVTMIKQIVVIVAVLGATYAVEAAVAHREAEHDEMAVTIHKAADRGQRGRAWYARHDAERGQVGKVTRV